MRLRDIYQAVSEEDLARQTGLSVRTLNRWKSAKTPGSMKQFDAFVKALDLAGLLRTPGSEEDESGWREARIRAAATRLADGLDEMIQALQNPGPQASAEGSQARRARG